MFAACLAGSNASNASAATLTLDTGLGLIHPGNLVTNGSFENQASGTTFHYWATGTLLNPYEPIDNWTSIGGIDAYALRINGPTTAGSDTIPDGDYGIYFGNQFASSISETPTFQPNGRVQFTTTPTIVPKGGSGSGYDPAVHDGTGPF